MLKYSYYLSLGWKRTHLKILHSGQMNAWAQEGKIKILYKALSIGSKGQKPGFALRKLIWAWEGKTPTNILLIAGQCHWVQRSKTRVCIKKAHLGLTPTNILLIAGQSKAVVLEGKDSHQYNSFNGSRTISLGPKVKKQCHQYTIQSFNGSRIKSLGSKVKKQTSTSILYGANGSRTISLGLKNHKESSPGLGREEYNF